MRPVLFSVGHVDFFSAPIFAGLSALAAYFYYARNRPSGLSEEDFWNLMMRLAVGVIAGSVLLYFLAYGPGFAGNVKRLLARRRVPGGSFFGSLLGATALAYAYCRSRNLPFGPVADPLGPASLLALSIMRLGCLLNGCCYGRPTDLPWGLVFTDPRCNVRDSWLGRPLHPTQVYEAAGSLAILLFVHFAALRRVRSGRWPAGSAFALSLGLYCVLRFALDFTRGGDPGVFRLVGLGTSQWIAAACLLALTPLLRPRRR